MPPRINIPPVTRIVLIVLGVQSVLSAAIRYRQWTANSEIVIPYLNLVPQLSLVYPWTFLSATLVESNVFTLSIACATLYNGGRYLERAWSSREFAKFLLITSLVPNGLCFVTSIFFFALTRNEGWTLMTIAGTIPLQISFLVAFSQLVPAHTVTLFRGLLSLRVPRFPLLYIILVTLLCLTPMLTAASFLLAIYGFLVSWTYLRFYKVAFPDLDTSQTSSLRGDASETFAIAEFFPGPIRPLIATISEQVFNVLVVMRLCVPFSAADISAARGDHHSHHNFSHRGAPGSARAEAERRRALALRALDQRLHAATANAASRAQNAPVPPTVAPPIPSATGPTVQNQPQATPPNAMTAQAGGGSGMLGETNYNPDADTDRNGP
ncbi:eukaryotic integral membrane protein-domain-containing protein [Dichotomopilus funicola]|uniref:Eukaryotic integral membrane protein-domain-containing protein n=1 Tax=Dichotomopilus funicola TaxID=1934379 RepID=A0AAN6V5S2_9PEZI|nr:eukaryotic integral membrane protein-domain-containing protein [Dichotomopilus funicola]